jgi:hypothetical protein
VNGRMNWRIIFTQFTLSFFLNFISLESSNGYSISDGCFVPGSKNYMGTINKTVRGLTCQAWTIQTPQLHKMNKDSLFPDGTVADALNYCRVIDEKAPWCYTTEKNTRWDYCDVPICGNMECKLTEQGTEYHGKVSMTKSGQVCQAWSSQTPHSHEHTSTAKFMERNITAAANYCRNPDGSVGPWCYTTDPNIQREYCDIPLCGSDTCKKTIKGREYFGSVNVTKSGIQCNKWDESSTNSIKFPEGIKEGAMNYCRNPDDGEGPWCYVSDPKIRWEHCLIPDCGAIKSRSAYQSSIMWSGGPEILIDSNYYKDVCTTTIGFHWMTVDLGFRADVTLVRLYLKTGSYKSLEGYEIAVGDNFRKCSLENNGFNYAVCGIVETNNSNVIDIKCSAQGRYVMLRAPFVKSNYICVKEILVFGSESKSSNTLLPPAFTNTCDITNAENGNILQGKPVSHYPKSSLSQYANDNNLSTIIKTTRTFYSWIAIDMQEVMTVNFIRLWPDKNNNNLATTFSVYVGTKYLPCETKNDDFLATWKICKSFKNVNLTVNDVLEGYCESPIIGQYVIVTYGNPLDRQIPKKVLSFKEIEAFGSATEQSPIESPQIDLISNNLLMSSVMPIRESIFGNLMTINVPPKMNQLYFISANTESLLWNPETKRHIIAATQIDKGRLIISASEELISQIMNNSSFDSVWKGMKSWLGVKNAPLRNITDNFIKGDFVIAIGNVNVTSTQVEKAISMLKTGDISMIFALSPQRLSSKTPLESLTLFEICRTSKVFLGYDYGTNGSQTTLSLPTSEAPDFCGLGPEKILRLAVTSPRLFSECRLTFESMLSIPLGLHSLSDQTLMKNLALNVTNTYDKFVRFNQPCDASPLRDNSTKEFIYGYNGFLKIPFLTFTGIKAPGASEFPGDFPSSSVVRER